MIKDKKRYAGRVDLPVTDTDDVGCPMGTLAFGFSWSYSLKSNLVNLSTIFTLPTGTKITEQKPMRKNALSVFLCYSCALWLLLEKLGN